MDEEIYKHGLPSFSLAIARNKHLAAPASGPMPEAYDELVSMRPATE
jgi:hypothetical protein